MEVALLLVAEADAVLAGLLLLLGGSLRDDIDLLVDLVVLFKNVLLSGVESGLESHEHLDHELGVLGVRPIVNVRLEVGAIAPWLTMLFLHPEVYLEQVYEISKEEAPVDVRSNMIRQFRHEPLIDLLLNRVVFVIRPIVLEISLESLSHLFGQWATPVEVSEQTKPFGQIFAVLVVCGHVLQVHQNVNELTHNVSEASDTNEKDKGRNDTLNLTLGIVVTETDSRQRCEGKIDNDDQILPVAFVFQSIFIVKSELLRICLQICCMLRDDEPDRPDEVRENQDEENETEDSEDVHQVDLIHDLIVVFSHGLQLVVILNTAIDASTVETLQEALELLCVQQEEHLVKTEETQEVEQVELVLVPAILENFHPEDA